jgi:hypothetical protein
MFLPFERRLCSFMAGRGRVTGIGTVKQNSVNVYRNSSSDVAGCNVYRSTTPEGTHSKINSALDENTAVILYPPAFMERDFMGLSRKETPQAEHGRNWKRVRRRTALFHSRCFRRILWAAFSERVDVQFAFVI